MEVREAAGWKGRNIPFAEIGCRMVPPDPGWNLHRLLTSEGAWAAPQRVMPYQNNLLHWYARNRYFDAPVDSGDERGLTQVAPGSADRGIVLMRAFIRNSSAFNDTIGDHRGFSDDPYASAKIGIAWDTGTGEIGVYIHRSCVIGNTVLFGGVSYACLPAEPVKFVPDASIYGDNNTDPFNYVSVTKTGNDLVVKVAAINAYQEVFDAVQNLTLGRINATITLTAVPAGYNVTLVSDKYPAWEFYRYKTFDTLMASTMGTYGLLGTRDQTSLGDLLEPQSTCTSTGEVFEGTLRPMPCQ